MQEECSFQHFSVHYEFGHFVCESELFNKVMTHNLFQNTNFENGVNTIQMGIMHVGTVEHFANIFTV